LTNGSPAGLPGGAINEFWERGEISELSQLGNGTALAGVSMSNTFDRGREELVRRSIEMLTMRGSVFSVYVVAQSLQISGGSTNVLATARLRKSTVVGPFSSDKSSTYDRQVAVSTVHMDLRVTSGGRASFAWVTGDPVANTLEPGQLFDVDMDHVAGPLPLVSLHRWRGVEVPQPVQPQAPHRPGQGADRNQQQSGDLPEDAALVPELHGLLQLLRAVRSLIQWSAAS
jgi:hypothetical protein